MPPGSPTGRNGRGIVADSVLETTGSNQKAAAETPWI